MKTKSIAATRKNPIWDRVKVKPGTSRTSFFEIPKGSCKTERDTNLCQKGLLCGKDFELFAIELHFAPGTDQASKEQIIGDSMLHIHIDCECVLEVPLEHVMHHQNHCCHYEIAVPEDGGGAPYVIREGAHFEAFLSHPGGLSVGVADVTGDGEPDLIVASQGIDLPGEVAVTLYFNGLLHRRG